MQRFLAALLVPALASGHGLRDWYQHHHHADCITEEEIKEAQAVWAGALVSIGEAWVGGADKTAPAQNCAAANAVAKKAISGAYAYHVTGLNVQFKPTLTVEPTTFRPTYDGAVSYFVGLCSGEAHVKGDNGFALGYTVSSDPSDPSTWWGYAKAEFYGM